MISSRSPLRAFPLALFMLLFTLEGMKVRSARADDTTATKQDVIAVVLRMPGDRVALRLRAELEAAGFAVVLVDEPAKVDGAPSALDVIARDAGAIAAIRLISTKKGIEVWIVDRVTGKTVAREVVPPAASPTETEGLVAIRAVELLRASLLEITAAHPPRGDVPKSDAVQTWIAPKPPEPAPPVDVVKPVELERPTRVAAELAPAVALSAGSVPASLHALVGARVRVTDRFAARAFVLLPSAPSTIDRDEGRALVGLSMIGLGVHVPLVLRRSFEPSAGLGVAIAWLRVDGSARTPFAGERHDAIAFAPYLRAGVAYVLSARLRIAADVALGVALPRPVVRFVGRDVAAWGRPWFLGSIALEVAL